jgi:serine/threonine protein kinase
MENILVCSSDAGSGIVAKLSDFGLSMFVGEIDPTPQKLPGGTQPWNSPEWRESRPSKDFYKSDMYSAGLLIWATFSLGEDPFDQEGHNIFAEPEILPTDSREEQLSKIENLKRSDKILEIACRTTVVTLTSFDNRSRSLQNTFFRPKSNINHSLLTALKTVL